MVDYPYRDCGACGAMPDAASKVQFWSGNDGIQMVVWITGEFNVDPVQRACMESVVTPETAAMLAVYNPGGFPVRAEVQMGPIQMWSELESIVQKSAPAGTYEVPPGYDGCEQAN